MSVSKGIKIERNKYMKNWHAQHPDYWKNYRRTHVKQVRATKRKSYHKLRRSLFDLLGDKCARCGFSDTRILQFDHINGGGVKQQRLLGSNYAIYLYYKSHPDEAKHDLQVLCPNCNMLKRLENNEQPYRSNWIKREENKEWGVGGLGKKW